MIICQKEVLTDHKRLLMTSPTTTVKEERHDDSYDDSEVGRSMMSYVRCTTPVAKSPKEANSPKKIMANEDNDIHPPKKRARFNINKLPLQNGHTESKTLFMSPAYEHYEGSHSSDMLRSLNQRRLQDQFVDLVLVLDGKEIPCHKVVLCSVSEYFSELLVPNAATRYQQRVHVNETTMEIMTQLIEFAYTSRIEITDKNIEKLLNAAKIFKFRTVHEACTMVLKQRLSAKNCISIKRFASNQGCDGLAERAASFVYNHFSEVSRSEDFNDLTLKELLSFISSKNLNVKNEEVVYEAVLKWIRYDAKLRKQHLPTILEHVRLPLVKPQFLLDVVQSETFIKNNKECEKYLDEARRFQLLADQRPLMQSCRTMPRLAYSVKRSEILVTIGGLNKEKVPIQDCTYFDFPNPLSQQLAPMKINQTAYSVTAVNNNIFVTGGAFNTPYKEVWMYIPSLDKWRQVAPMHEARYLHSSIGLDGYLYVIGGHNGKDRLRSVEKYNPDTNTWQYCEAMLRELSSPTVVTCEGLLYVIGGAKGSDPSDIVCDVQCYNPSSKTWKLASPLPQPERGAVAADLNGTIYVMGQHRSVLSYNRKNNKWTKLSDTNGGHLHGAATVHRGQLYVAGGLHGNTYINGTVEVYDSVNDSWQVTTTLHVPVYAQGFVSIFKDDASG